MDSRVPGIEWWGRSLPRLLAWAPTYAGTVCILMYALDGKNANDPTLQRLYSAGAVVSRAHEALRLYPCIHMSNICAAWFPYSILNINSLAPIHDLD